jgi:hypothetical protein
VVVSQKPLYAQGIQFDVVVYHKTSQTAALSGDVFGLPRVGRRVTTSFARAVELELEVVEAALRCNFGEVVIGAPVLIPLHSCRHGLGKISSFFN